MIKLAFIFSLLFTINATAFTNKNLDENLSECDHLTLEESILQESLFSYTPNDCPTDIDWDSIDLTEPEEEIDLGFDTKDYLPEGFNPLKGKHDLDWNKIELIELDEEVELGFDTNKYLPKNFNPYVGMDVS